MRFVTLLTKTHLIIFSYTLDHPFKGNSHVVYNGSFYYNARDKTKIIKFHLATKRYHSLDVPGVATNGSNYLYTTKYNYMDFNVDDNGLWVIYGMPSSNNTIVMKVRNFFDVSKM